MQKPFAEYTGQLQDAAAVLEKLPRIDGGWGLRPTSVASIVNTAEALVVLRAAGKKSDAVEHGLDYLLKALPEYCRPESTEPGQGGRGEHVRYVSFFLDGLLTYPERAFAPDGLAGLRWSLRFLSQFSDSKYALRGAFPETVDSKRVSLHQTARVLGALSRLLFLESNISGLSATERAGALQMAQGAADYLIRLQARDGSWPERPGTPGPDAVKTSLAVTALGYFAHINDAENVKKSRLEGGKWLLANYKTWVYGTSSDALEQSTDWVHIAYAECVRGVLAGISDASKQLSPSWRYMTDKRWSEEEQLWSEPSLGGGGNATIRASYHTVMAFESAKDDSRLMLPKPLEVIDASNVGAFVKIEMAPPAKDKSRVVSVIGRDSTARARLSARLASLVELISSSRGGLTTDQLAKSTGLVANSISQNIRRVNQEVSSKTRNAVPELITKIEDGKRAVYRIEVD